MQKKYNIRFTADQQTTTREAVARVNAAREKAQRCWKKAQESLRELQTACEERGEQMDALLAHAESLRDEISAYTDKHSHDFDAVTQTAHDAWFDSWQGNIEELESLQEELADTAAVDDVLDTIVDDSIDKDPLPEFIFTPEGLA